MRLYIQALRVLFEERYKGHIKITRLNSGEYLSPAVEREWQQFLRFKLQQSE